MRYSEPTAAFHKSMSGQTFRSNGPFCRESLPYPIVVRREKARIFRGIDVTLQMFHPPTLVPVQLQSPSQRFLNSLSGSNHVGNLAKERFHATPSPHHCPPPSAPRLSRSRPDRLDRLWSNLGCRPTPMTNLGGLCLELLSGKGLESAFRKYSVNPSPALAFSRSDGYSRPSWTTDQPPCSVSRPCGSQSRNWHPSLLVRHRIPRHRNPFVPPRLSPSAPVRFARG